MTNQVLKLPFYAKMFILLIGIFVLLIMLYIAQDLIIPILFSVIIAIILHPVVSLLVRWRINRVGAIIVASIPMMIAVVTKASPWFALLVLALFVFIQFIDSNYILPKLVASKVKLNALVSIIVVVGFAALWEIPGIVLSILLTAIVKLIFDPIETLKTWGFLLGDNKSPSIKNKKN